MKLIENKEFLAEFDALLEKYSEKQYHPVPVKEETGALKELLDAEKDSFKIERGKWYMCIKATDNFKVDKAYLCDEDGILIDDESGNWTNKKQCFRPATEDEIPHEPRFKVGDYIVDKEDKETFKVTKVLDNTYGIVSVNDGAEFNMPHYTIEDNYRLYDITKDAKDGDVLANDYFIIIFKRLWQCKTAFDWTCGIEFADDNWTFDSKGEDDFDPKGLHPATKEQRDLLFSKMREAGYEWDADKKELKKIVKRWRDDKDARISGYLTNSQGEICIASDQRRNMMVYPTEALAKRAVAMKEIAQIMQNDKRFGGLVTWDDWKSNDLKYCLRRNIIYGVEHVETNTICYFLAFHTAEQRGLFMQENLDLVEDYLMTPKKEE